jgi:hypothetical protein
MPKWTEAEDGQLRGLYATHTRNQIAQVMGRTEGQVRSRCWTLGLNQKKKFWTPELLDKLREAYKHVPLMADELATAVGMSNVHRKARELGLTDKHRKKVAERKDKRLTANEEELRQLQSSRAVERIRKHGHPRGALGMRHGPETLLKLSRSSKARWEAMSSDERAEHVRKTQTALTLSGKRNKSRKGTTWKAAWREIGGHRKYYRSRWEANYARYLEWLRVQGRVEIWKHEPDIFWFDGIKRGCVSYLPDFRVHWTDGRVEYHEVKGWMDAQSKTKIRRMKKYHPTVKLVVVDSKAYRKLASAVGGLIDEWE